MTRQRIPGPRGQQRGRLCLWTLRAQMHPKSGRYCADRPIRLFPPICWLTICCTCRIEWTNNNKLTLHPGWSANLERILPAPEPERFWPIPCPYVKAAAAAAVPSAALTHGPVELICKYPGQVVFRNPSQGPALARGVARSPAVARWTARAYAHFRAKPRVPTLPATSRGRW